MSDNNIILLILCIFAAFTILGVAVGLNVQGQIQTSSINNNPGGIIETVKTAWSGIQFLFSDYSVAGIPAWETMVFTIIGILLVWILAKWIRGTNS